MAAVDLTGDQWGSSPPTAHHVITRTQSDITNTSNTYTSSPLSLTLLSSRTRVRETDPSREGGELVSPVVAAYHSTRPNTRSGQNYLHDLHRTGWAEVQIENLDMVSNLINNLKGLCSVTSTERNSQL